MAATADQIRRLRRMISEPTEDTYTDTDLAEYLARWPLMDADGNTPSEEDWDSTSLDLHAAASDLWTEKASCAASSHDTSTDFSRQYKSQAHAQMLKMARHHLSRRAIVGMLPEVRPRPMTLDVYIGNQAEETDF